ncbi:MAG: hypothetical protein EOO38_00035 [Cytophagaceae bacterium]|nr:MAG: hypothetical protein EOO38_00035 [Cytophagaceae bacterium]
MPPMLKTRVRVIDKKERQRRLEIVARASRGSYAKVGVTKPEQKYPGSDVTVGQVAAWMEFGTDPPEGKEKGGTPARSFLRTPIDNLGDKLNAKRDAMLEQIIAGKLSIADALQQLGFFVANTVRNAIITDIPPPLAQRTRDNKRSNRMYKGVSKTPDSPLQDTGLLLSKIGYEVVLRGGGGS